jgi:Holliday junction resolvase RusA-like endonuclease
MYFEVIGFPQGKSRARTFYNPKLGKHQSITPENTVLYENLIKTSYLAAENRKSFFNKEPVEMYITAHFPIPKSTTKKDRERIRNKELFPIKKPDSDNIAKVICDALNGVAYHDDTQVVRLEVRKVFTEEEPKVVVALGEFDGYPF